MKQIIVCMLLITTIGSKGQNLNKEITNILDREIQKYVEEGAPGIAVGIVKEGAIVYQKYTGYSNLEHKVKIDENTSFNIASNAKQFTAICILVLINEGRLNLEDDIRTYLPALFKNIPYRITISNLLTHTSGIRDVYDLWALKGKTWWKLFIDNSDAIEMLQAQAGLNFKPGTEYMYSNSNYIILTEIISKVTNTDFSEYAKALFQKLGMPNTGFLTNYMAVVPNKARPYGNWSGWREYPFITEIHGDGALFTTLKDQLQWEQLLQRNTGKYISKKLITASQAKIKDSIQSNYGYGLMFGNYKGLDYAYHDGNTGAYNATFLRFKNEGLAIVVNSNNGNVPTNYLAKQLANLLLEPERKNEVFPAMPPKIEKTKNYKDVLGHYRNKKGTIISIVEKEGQIYRQIYKRDPVKLINEKGGLFHYESNTDLKMNFTNIGEPKQQFTLYLSTQRPDTYYKISNSDLTGYQSESLNGNFYNEETDTEIVIAFLENNIFSITKNGRERKAELIFKDYLRMNSYEIEVIRDKQGNVTGLNIANGRIKNVNFNKRSR